MPTCPRCQTWLTRSELVTPVGAGPNATRDRCPRDGSRVNVLPPAERSRSYDELGWEERALIARFEATVQAHRGQYWAPESALPCDKMALLELLRGAKSSAREGDGTYERLATLVVDLSHFIPDEDLRAAEGYLTEKGGVIAGELDADRGRKRDRLVEVFRERRAERDRLQEVALIEGRGPIGMARWTALRYKGWESGGRVFDAVRGVYDDELRPPLRPAPG